MNEKTMIEKQPVIDRQNEGKNESNAWKYITLGGVSGILMGAGLLYAGQVVAATESDGETADDAPTEDSVSEVSLPVAQIHNDLSFGEAFAAARAEVGPGGVFIWHGGIYNTYTAEEWNAMTAEQKNDFAHQVNPEVRAHDIPTPTDAHPDVAVLHADDVHIVDQSAAVADADDDVHIVGYTDIEGHLAVGLDTDGDGQADVAIIDMDDNQELSAPDLVIDKEGNYATVGELTNDHNPNMDAIDESPDMTQTEFDFPVIEA